MGPVDALHTAVGIGVAVREVARAGIDRVVPGGNDVPRRTEEIDAGWLTSILALPAGAVRSVEVVDSHSGTAARARIAVDADGLPDHLFVKFTPENFIQQVMMNLFGLGTAEVLGYRALGATPPVRIPRCYGSRMDARRGRVILVLEDLSPTATFRTVLDSVTDVEAEAVADAMVDQHLAFWESDRFRGDLRQLAGRSDAADWFGDLIRRRFIGGMRSEAASIVPAAMKQESAILFERSKAVAAMWRAQPQTLIHGDPHLGNLFFEGATPGFFDWQVAASGVGVRDLAYFACASVEPDQLRSIERDLVERYGKGLEAGRVTVDHDRLWDLYRAGITEFFMSAVSALEAGERAQPVDIARSGVVRAVAAAEALDSFGVLARLSA